MFLMLKLTLIVLAVAFSYIRAQDEENPIVETTKGLVQGRRIQMHYGENSKYKPYVNSFYGIPFGLPPVDELRFEVCVWMNNWNFSCFSLVYMNWSLMYVFGLCPMYCLGFEVFGLTPVDELSFEVCTYVHVFCPIDDVVWCDSNWSKVSGTVLALLWCVCFCSNRLNCAVMCCSVFVDGVSFFFVLWNQITAFNLPFKS